MANDNLRGILLILAAMALFAIEDAFIKLVAVDLPVGQIIFVLGVCGAPIFGLMARAQGARIWTKTALHPAVMLRNLGEMLGTLGFVTALAALPLGQVQAVMQSMPLVITMAAALFLGERVGWRRWSAIATGFIGVLIVIRPGFAGFQLDTLWMLLGAAGLSMRDVVARRIPTDVSNTQVSAWGLWSVALLGVGMMAVSGGVHLPNGTQSLYLFGGVLFGTAGYWAITAAARIGEVAVVAPFRYARLVFAIVIGLFIFAEVPDSATLIGAFIIVTSGLYAFARQRALSKAKAIG
jgi:drug/metabolite transporter (DMT)-like permease